MGRVEVSGTKEHDSRLELLVPNLDCLRVITGFLSLINPDLAAEAKRMNN